MFIFFIIMFQRQKNMSKFIKVQTFFLNFLFCIWVQLIKGFPGGASGKKPGCQCKRHKRRGSLPGSVRSPEEENGNPLQYSCLANPMGRGAWWAMVHRVAKSQTQLKQLSTHAHSSLTNNTVIVSREQQRDTVIQIQEFIPLKPASQPSCHITLSRALQSVDLKCVQFTEYQLCL